MELKREVTRWCEGFEAICIYRNSSFAMQIQWEAVGSYFHVQGTDSPRPVVSVTRDSSSSYCCRSLLQLFSFSILRTLSMHKPTPFHNKQFQTEHEHKIELFFSCLNGK